MLKTLRSTFRIKRFIKKRISKKAEEATMRKNLNDNLAFFEKMRDEVKHECAIKIQ